MVSSAMIQTLTPTVMKVWGAGIERSPPGQPTHKVRVDESFNGSLLVPLLLRLECLLAHRMSIC